METYIKYAFWIGALGWFICLGRLCGDHPRRPEPVNVGLDAATFIWSTAVQAWVAYLFFNLP